MIFVYFPRVWNTWKNGLAKDLEEKETAWLRMLI